MKEFKETGFCKSQSPGLEERVENTVRLWFVPAGNQLESLVWVETLTRALMGSVGRMGKWYTKSRQSSVDEEYNRQSKWRNYSLVDFWMKVAPCQSTQGFLGERGVRGYLWIWVKPNGTTLTTILLPHFPFLIYLLLTSWGCFQEHPCVVIAALPQNRSLILQGFFSSGSCWLYCSPFTDECMLNKLAGYFLIFVIFFLLLLGLHFSTSEQGQLWLC